MSDQSTKAPNPEPQESLEQKLIKKHSENVTKMHDQREQYDKQRKQLDDAIALIDDRIKVLGGAIAGLNELVELKKKESSDVQKA